MKCHPQMTIATIIAVVFTVAGSCNQTGESRQQALAKKLIEIDETGIQEKIVQTITIDSVWAGHPVGFCLLTHNSRQYIAYYNSNRNMVVGQRGLSDDKFSLLIIPPLYRENSGGISTVLGWDSHNYITMAIDKKGFIHLAGNMHVNPLTYFRSSMPGDIFSLELVKKMTGTEEDRCTYPKFMKTPDEQLLFHYRDGTSGNGNEIYNIWSCETESWSRLLETPLTDGLGLMNAYQSQPAILSDGWYHLYWVWRDTPDCSTNHDLSYMKSPDLKNWYNVSNEPVDLPATINNRSLIVDPIPVKGGIINLAARLCLDENQKPVFVYHKYDSAGYLQFYIARYDDNSWTYKQITDWNYRWEFSGGGSIVVEVRINGFKRRTDGNYEVSYYHKIYGTGTFLLDNQFDIIGTVRKGAPATAGMKPEGTFPGLSVRTASDEGKSEETGVRYILKWETLPSNRDRARPEPWPEPSVLYLLKLKSGI